MSKPSLKELFEESQKSAKERKAHSDTLKFILKVAHRILEETTDRPIRKRDVYDCVYCDPKEDPIERLRQEFPGTLLDTIGFYDRKYRVKLMDLINKPSEMGVWKAFVKKQTTDGNATIVFHMLSQLEPWVITNMTSGYVPNTDEPLKGAIVVYVRGDNMPVQIVPLSTYLKEIKQ
jgi:hypothetical protein